MPRLVFVGYDPNEDLSFRVCKNSLERLSKDVQVVPLSSRELRRLGLFKRRWFIDENGQMWDHEDGKPCSTEFSFTRFLVPEICRQLGHDGPALFVDSDFLFLAPADELFDMFDPNYAVQVVKFNWQPINSFKKEMSLQTRYNRKLWSSLVLWNVPANSNLTGEIVNTAVGSHLHAFGWLPDEFIGELPAEWNHIPGVSEPLDFFPKAVHYSLGGPWLKDFEDKELSYLWQTELESLPRKSLTSRLFPALGTMLPTPARS